MDKDPFNVIVTGVGGQGNVMASLLIGAVLVEKGYKVTIGETYGASQRGGAVMSHLRICLNKTLGPLIPPRSADLVIALEPIEAIRVLHLYGNPDTCCVVNTRPVYPVDVIAGDLCYPDLTDLTRKIQALSKRTYFIEATSRALEMGNTVLANIIMIGAVAAANFLPITEQELSEAVASYMAPDKVEINREAFNQGFKMLIDQEQT